MSLGALVEPRARDAQSRWHCEANGIYFWEPTGDTIYVSKTTNITWAVHALQAAVLVVRRGDGHSRVVVGDV